MASFNAVALTVLEICAFKVRKTGYFKKDFLLMKFQKMGTNLCFLSFQNWFLSKYFTTSPEPVDQNQSLTPLWKANFKIMKI